jgi:hypothetical protein
VIFFLPIPTTSHGNPIWRMYYEVNECIRLPLEKKNPPPMLKRKPNGIIKMAKHID